MPKIPSRLNTRDPLRKTMFKPIKCVACGGTGVSSSGKPCVPCQATKKPLEVKYCSTIQAAKLVNDKPFDIFDL